MLQETACNVIPATAAVSANGQTAPPPLRHPADDVVPGRSLKPPALSELPAGVAGASFPVATVLLAGSQEEHTTQIPALPTLKTQLSGLSIPGLVSADNSSAALKEASRGADARACFDWAVRSDVTVLQNELVVLRQEVMLLQAQVQALQLMPAATIAAALPFLSLQHWQLPMHYQAQEQAASQFILQQQQQQQQHQHQHQHQHQAACLVEAGAGWPVEPSWCGHSLSPCSNYLGSMSHSPGTMDSSPDLQSQAEMTAIDRLIAEAELAVSAAPCHDELSLSPARPETLTEQQTEQHAGLQCESEAAAAPNEPKCNSVAPHIGVASEPPIDSHLAPVPLLRIPAEYSEDDGNCSDDDVDEALGRKYGLLLNGGQNTAERMWEKYMDD